jgi:hypothetical protein
MSSLRPRSLQISHGEGSFKMDGFTERDLDHLFLALALHTKTTRKEQNEWVIERRNIWKALVALSVAEPDSERVKLRTKFFETPEDLKKDSTVLEKAFSASAGKS